MTFAVARIHRRRDRGREVTRAPRLNDEYDNETADGGQRLDAYRQRQVNGAGTRSESNAEGDNPMSLPTIVSREEWLIARKQLLTKEKEATRLRDALNADRRRLPMVEVVKDYAFEGPDGQVGLLDLFEGRRQLIVDHFMWPDLDSDDGCPSCAGRVDQYGNLAHLHARDTTIAVVSRAPLTKIEPFKHRMGWTFPWYSSHGSDFNYDYHVTLDESVAPLEYNYRNKAELEQAGFPPDMTGDLHGTSVFLRDDDRVFHTYSTYGRGTEQVGGTHYYLDMTALGRQEDWEEPSGRSAGLGPSAGDPAVQLTR